MIRRKTGMLFVVLAIAVALASAVEDLVQAEEPGSCCATSQDCTSGDFPICCDPEKMGAFNCSNHPDIGYCRSGCAKAD